MSEEKKTKNYATPDCFNPEKNNPYPLCVGREDEECESCCLWVDYSDLKIFEKPKEDNPPKDIPCVCCRFFIRNEVINAFGTCKIQNKPSHCACECRLTAEEIRELEESTGQSRKLKRGEY
ncbi:hypothetical protein M2146_002547 [Lachnospiraceae bacterium PF1-22]